jgi:DNA polymerase
MARIKDLVKTILDEEILDNASDFIVSEDDLKKFNTLFSEKDSLPKNELFENLQKKYKDCKNCDLCKTRKNVIFGDGSCDAKLMFIAESPWQEENDSSKSFIGEKGELLTKIIEAINLKRENVFITDIVKCYPIDEVTNARRTPTESEISSCIKILDQQIDIIKPKIICTLGNTATKNLLKTDKEITQIRGEVFHYKKITLIPTFHPAFLLRQPSAKKLVWEDMKKIKRMLEE